jgi:hypothetical protein
MWRSWSRVSLSLLRRGLGYFHKYQNRTYDRVLGDLPQRDGCIGEPGDALDGVIGNHHSKFGTIDARNKPCGTGQPGRIDKRPRLKERGFLR